MNRNTTILISHNVINNKSSLKEIKTEDKIIDNDYKKNDCPSSINSKNFKKEN